MHAPLILHEKPDADGTCRLTVAGELDIATAPQLRRSVSALMGSGCRDVVVDLTETTFLDSCGLGALVWASHRMHAAGGTLTILNPVGSVAKVIDVAGVDQVLLRA